MTRFMYGGGGDSEVNAPSGTPRASAPAGVYNARTLGTLVTDILDMSGAALAGTVTTDAFGQALFQGPDGYTATLWLDFGVGPRWGVSPKQIDQPNAGGKIIADQRAIDLSGSTLTLKSSLPTNASDPLLAAAMAALDPLGIPRFPSAATRNVAFPSPADGDCVYRTDLHCRQVYNSAIARWVSDPALIGEILVSGSTTNSVTFTSIPQEWSTLRIVAATKRCNTSSSTKKFAPSAVVQFNGDTAANYASYGPSRLAKNVSGTTTYGISTVDASGGSTTPSAVSPSHVTTGEGNGGFLGLVPGESTIANSCGYLDLLIPDYTDTTHMQVYNSRGGFDSIGTTTYMSESEQRGSWATLAAITSITVAITTATFYGTGSYFRLYGM